VDFVGAGAIPPVRARSASIALACTAAFGAHADCTKLDGTYRFRPTEQGSESTESLANLAAVGRDAAKLIRYEAIPHVQGNPLTSPAARGRPKIADIAVAGTLSYAPGAVRWRFVDAAGKPLATLPLEASRPWTCSGDRLTRTFQRIAGLGDNIRTDRIEEVLERGSAGTLVHRETITVIEGGKGTRVRESHYPAASAASR
jgi:hypothetical protein